MTHKNYPKEYLSSLTANHIAKWTSSQINSSLTRFNSPGLWKSDTNCTKTGGTRRTYNYQSALKSSMTFHMSSRLEIMWSMCAWTHERMSWPSRWVSKGLSWRDGSKQKLPSSSPNISSSISFFSISIRPFLVFLHYRTIPFQHPLSHHILSLWLVIISLMNSLLPENQDIAPDFTAPWLLFESKHPHRNLIKCSQTRNHPKHLAKIHATMAPHLSRPSHIGHWKTSQSDRAQDADQNETMEYILVLLCQCFTSPVPKSSWSVKRNVGKKKFKKKNQIKALKKAVNWYRWNCSRLNRLHMLPQFRCLC